MKNDSNSLVHRQLVVTPEMGKKIIARAVASLPQIKQALTDRTIVVVAGTTNGYVAEELLEEIGQAAEFSRRDFFRGYTFPPGTKTENKETYYDPEGFSGDVVIRKGVWEREKTISEVVGSLEEGDIIFKGANALYLEDKTAGILIGDTKGGTVLKALQAVIGRRVDFYLPVGLEKRVPQNLNKTAASLNSPGASGPRMMVVQGKVITEIEALNILTGVQVEMTAAGGIEGAEGSYYLSISGEERQVKKAADIISESCS